MQIIDAHHHLWAPQSPELDIGYVWLKDIGAPKPFGDPTAIQRDYLLDEYLAEPSPQQLAASVHVQADPRLPDPVAETAFVQNLSDSSGHPIMIVGFADLSSRRFEETVLGHLAYPNLRGIRQILSHLPTHPELSFAATNLLDDPTWVGQFELLAEHDLSFDLQLYPEQMLQAAAVLAKHPEVPVVIDHLGSPYDSTADGLQKWSAGMRALAQLGNVSVKLSGYAMFFGADLGAAAARVTQEILEYFGTDRVMFGSNFPVDKLHLTYEEIIDFVALQLGANETDKHQVFYETSARVYRISQTGGTTP